MKKEEYKTPDVKTVEVKNTDIIRTSVFELNSNDELAGITKDFFEEGNGLYDLF